MSELTKASWEKIDQSIKNWLHERQELIMYMCAVTGLEEYTPQHTPKSIKTQAFCQLLIDYVSAGHFEIYQQLMNEASEAGIESDALFNQAYPALHTSTEIAIAFNDKYDTNEHCEARQHQLPKDLSMLGELLEERFEWEDRLIDELHANQQARVA